MSETSRVLIPAGLSPELQAILTKANPSVAFIATQPNAAAPADGYHKEAIPVVNGWVLSAVAGAVTLIPPPWGPLAGLIVKGLGPTIINAITKTPAQERWTLSDLQGLEDSVALPAN